MVILQSGIAKSGNFWLYTILQKILNHARLKHRSFIQNHPIHKQAQTWELTFNRHADMDFIDIVPDGCYARLGNQFREPIEDIDAYIAACRHVWTHSTLCDRSFAILPKFDKIIYIMRDARDVAISLSKFMFTPHIIKYHPNYEGSADLFLTNVLDGMLREWVDHVGGYLKQREALGIHVVFYEQLLHNFDETLSNLLNYLEIELDQAAVAQIKQEVTFKSMQQEHPNHVRKGTFGQWQGVFTGTQKKQADQIAGQMIALLGYPTSRVKALESDTATMMSSTLPVLPADLSQHQLDQAIAQAQRTLHDEVLRVYDFVVSQRPVKAKAYRIYSWTSGRVKQLLQVGK
ncbi:sulfotransferase domain-containing protein [Chloroflexi bacterium TSY]|nr:sulfotransferase domain-containing protein [Chloroflexi bacterium TSY]